jgi:hypothetical protein
MPVDGAIFRQGAGMPYQEARSLIRNGDILLGHGRAPFSRAIQAATGSPWSHVGFIWRLEEIDRIMVLESVESFGVRAISLNTKINGGSTGKPYNGHLVIARHEDFDTHVDAAAMSRMTAFAVDRLGCPYAPWEVMGIGMRILIGALRLRTFGPPKPNSAYVCAEYAHECYQQIGVHIPWDHRGFIAPVDFASNAKVHPVAVLRPDPPA